MMLVVWVPANVGGPLVLVLLVIPLVPAAITIAVLRHQLLDIRLVFTRALLYGALLYGALTTGVVGGYLGLVAVADLALHRGTGVGGSVIATLVIALGFDPVRVRLQRHIDRLLYGDRADPVRAVSRLGEHLVRGGGKPDPGDALAVVRDALRLPYAALRVDGVGQAAGGYAPGCRYERPRPHPGPGGRRSPDRPGRLSALLGSVDGIEVAGTAANGREAVRAAVTLRPDVLVLDIQMPDLDGVAAAREITRAAPGVAILMLTMFDDDDSVLAALRAGASGYVLKGATQQEIIRAIHAVAAGEAIFGPGIARQVLGRAEAILRARREGLGRRPNP